MARRGDAPGADFCTFKDQARLIRIGQLIEVPEKFQRYLTTWERATIPKGFSVIADKAIYCHGFVTQLARVVASDADATKVSLQWPRPKFIGDVLPYGVEGALAFASRALASGENRRHDFAAAVEVADEK
jgi:hypothetical protein